LLQVEYGQKQTPLEWSFAKQDTSSETVLEIRNFHVILQRNKESLGLTGFDSG
jgi:hypothetical protein